MAKLLVVERTPVAVARVKAEGGPETFKDAFDLLESRMASLRGRKMFGLFFPPTGEYFASVQLDEEFPDDMGFERSTIPGGRYARRKIQGWSGKESNIKDWFDELAEEIKAGGHALDDERPDIEFYRSLTELIIFIPFK